MAAHLLDAMAAAVSVLAKVSGDIIMQDRVCE